MSMIHFDIIHHLSLGYGIILPGKETESPRTWRVYFADSGEVSQISRSFPNLIINPIMTIKQFVRIGLYEALFDERTKDRSLGYSNADTIHILEESDSGVRGEIKGTHKYAFSIRVGKNAGIDLFCSCPVDGPCKHLYAIFQYLKTKENETLYDPGDNETRTYLESFRSQEKVDYQKVISFIHIVHDKGLLEKTYHLAAISMNPHFKSRDIILRLILPSLLLDKDILSENQEILFNRESRNYHIAQETTANFQKLAHSSYPEFDKEVLTFGLIKALYQQDFDYLRTFLDRKQVSYLMENEFFSALIAYVTLYSVSLEDITELRSISAFSSSYRYLSEKDLPKDNKKAAQLLLLFPCELLNKKKYLSAISLSDLVRVIAASAYSSEYLLKALLMKLENENPEDPVAIGDAMVHVLNDGYVHHKETDELVKQIIGMLPHHSFLSLYASSWGYKL